MRLLVGQGTHPVCLCLCVYVPSANLFTSIYMDTTVAADCVFTRVFSLPSLTFPITLSRGHTIVPLCLRCHSLLRSPTVETAAKSSPTAVHNPPPAPTAPTASSAVSSADSAPDSPAERPPILLLHTPFDTEFAKVVPLVSSVQFTSVHMDAASHISTHRGKARVRSVSRKPSCRIGWPTVPLRPFVRQLSQWLITPQVSSL
jgi:hypothetical protein